MVERRRRGGWLVSIHASRCREAMQIAAGIYQRIEKVSIHASRCREAMRPLPRASCSPNCSFNPRLPLPGGDAHLP